MAKGRPDHPHRTCIVTAARLRSPAPHRAARHAHGLRSRLGVKDGDPAVLGKQVPAADHAGRVTCDARPDRAAGGAIAAALCLTGRARPRPPMCGSMASRRGRWGSPQGQPVSGVTPGRVRHRPVSHLRRGDGRAGRLQPTRSTPCNTQGAHGEPHDGPGTQHLSGRWALVLRLALVVDQTPPRCWAWCHAVGATPGPHTPPGGSGDARGAMTRPGWRGGHGTTPSGPACSSSPRSWRRLPRPLAHASLWDNLPSPQGLIPASGARDASRVS